MPFDVLIVLIITSRHPATRWSIMPVNVSLASIRFPIQERFSPPFQPILVLKYRTSTHSNERSNSVQTLDPGQFLALLECIQNVSLHHMQFIKMVQSVVITSLRNSKMSRSQISAVELEFQNLVTLYRPRTHCLSRSHRQHSVGNTRSPQVTPPRVTHTIEMYVAEYLALAGNIALIRVEALRYHL